MASPGDSTQVIRMLNEFDNFIDSHRSYSVGSNSQDVVTKLDYGDDTTVMSSGVRQRFSSDSVFGESSLDKMKLLQQINETDRKRKLKERELVLAKASVSKLEAHISASETSNKRTRLDFEMELSELKQENMKEKERAEDQTQQLNAMIKREEYHQRKLSEIKKQLAAQKTTYEVKVDSYQKENFSLQRKLTECQDSLQKMMSDHEDYVNNLKNQLKNSENLNEHYQLQVIGKDNRYEELKNEMIASSEAQMLYERAQQKIRNLEGKLQQQEETVMMAQIMKSKADKFPEIERENKELCYENDQLRALNDRRLLLEEQHEGMTKKIQRLESKLMEYNTVMLKNESLEEKLQDWTNACSNITDEPSPSTLNSLINNLLQSMTLLTSQNGASKTNCHMLEAELRNSEATVSELKKKLEALTKNESDHASFLKRLQRKLYRLTTERDSYRNLLNSYESDVTINPNALANEKIQILENMIQNYRNDSEKLEEELKAAQSSTSHSNPTASSFQSDSAALSQLKKEVGEKDSAIKSITDEKTALQQKFDAIISEIGYDPCQTKVVSYAMNPTAVAVQKRCDEMSELKEANEKLRQRISILEAKKGEEIEDLTVQVNARIEQQGSVQTREELQEKLTSAEMKKKRMMDAFKKTTNEFREVVYMLLGFKIDIPRTNFYKLSSMYAESPDDYLLFEMSSEGTLQFMETEYSKTVTELIETYLQRQCSIPAFLSMLTMDLFGRQTNAVF